jgi:hypothetical protein
MRKFYTCLFVLAVLATLPAWAFADEVTEEWQATFQDTTYHSTPKSYSITTDSEGNVYIGGAYARYLMLLKYDPQGNEVWTREYERGNDHWYVEVKVDGANNIYLFSRAYMGTIIVKYDSDGNLLWTTNVIIYYKGRAYSRAALDVEFDSDDNIYISSLLGWYGPVIFKLDKDGNILWEDIYNTNRGGSSRLALDEDNNVYLTSKRDIIKYDPEGNVIWTAINSLSITYTGDVVVDTAGNVYTLGNITGGMVLTKYDSGGNELWSSETDTTSGLNANFISLDNAGNIITTGSAYKFLITRQSCLRCHNFTREFNNGIIAKHDPSGNKLWENEEQMVIAALNLDSKGNSYVSGFSSNVPREFLNIKYDINGGELWKITRLYNNYASHLLNASLDNSGNLYATGIIIEPELMLTIKYSQGGLNEPPTADAGADQTVECATSEGAHVNLDGSGSTDQDGDALTYLWEGSFGSATGANPTVAIPLGTHTVTLTVDDGNEGTDTGTVTITVEDTTPPATSALLGGTVGNNAWYVSDVGVSLIATDSCSGVMELNYALDGTEHTVSGESASFTVSGDGDHSLAYGAKDNAGNQETRKTQPFKLDKTPPAIVISGVSDGATYALGQVPTASYEVTDAASGVASSSESLTGGDGLGLGTFTYTVTAVDNAGNKEVATAAYEVIATRAGTAALIDDLIASGEIAPQMRNSLIQMLENANLGALINHIEAQAGKKISAEAAEILINAVQYMIDN